MNNLFTRFVKFCNTYINGLEVDAILSALPKKHRNVISDVRKGVSENVTSKRNYNSDSNGRTYQLAKQKITDKLISTVQFIDSTNHIQKSKTEIYRWICAINILKLFGPRYIYVRLALKVLRKCLKYHMWHDVIELSRMLSSHYAMYEIDNKKSASYRYMCLRAIKLNQLEVNCEWAYVSVRNSLKEGKKLNLNHLDEIANSLEEKLDIDSFKSHFFYYAIRQLQYLELKDNKKTEDILLEALTYFKALDFDHSSAINFFSFMLVQLYMSMGYHQNSKELLSDLIKKTDKSTIHYIQFLELHLRINLFEAKELESKSLLEELKQYQKKTPNSDLHDRLLVYEVYHAIIAGKQLAGRTLSYHFNRLNKEKEEVMIPFMIGETIIKTINKTKDHLQAFERLTNLVKRLDKKNHKRTVTFVKNLTHVLNGEQKKVIPLPEKNELNTTSIEVVDYGILLNIISRNNIIKI